MRVYVGTAPAEVGVVKSTHETLVVDVVVINQVRIAHEGRANE